MGVATKVVYSLSAGAAIFFKLWQVSFWDGLFVWFALVTLWEMVMYLVDAIISGCSKTGSLERPLFLGFYDRGNKIPQAKAGERGSEMA
jgi:hypothetical protein